MVQQQQQQQEPPTKPQRHDADVASERLRRIGALRRILFGTLLLGPAVRLRPRLGHASAIAMFLGMGATILVGSLAALPGALAAGFVIGYVTAPFPGFSSWSEVLDAWFEHYPAADREAMDSLLRTGALAAVFDYTRYALPRLALVRWLGYEQALSSAAGKQDRGRH